MVDILDILHNFFKSTFSQNMRPVRKPGIVSFNRKGREKAVMIKSYN